MIAQMPNIVTTLRIKEKNFVLRVYAYRSLSDAEMKQALAEWLRQHNHKTVPKNKVGRLISIHGFDS